MGIRNRLRTVAAIYLLLNLCVATIPRCDNIFNFLQHALNKTWTEAPSCHEMTSSASQISVNHICECALVKFVFVVLPSFDPQNFIGFRIQSIALIQFQDALWNPGSPSGPEPPYPRWTLV